jgi:UDP-N-acetylmuramoylalanine--D-glutamate ligase
MARFCILGWGRTGVSAAQYLREQGNEIVVWDDDSQKCQNAVHEGFVLLTDDWDWRDVTVVASPGVGSHMVIDRARQEKSKIMTDIQLFFDFFPKVKAIAVTGSNGKTTTCALICHGLINHGMTCILAGNMGVPIFSTVHNGRPSPDTYVLELSSYQLELCSALPLSVAIVLNLFPHHLKRHGTVEEYGRIKQRILNHAQTRWISSTWPIPQQDQVLAAAYEDEKWSRCPENRNAEPASTYMWTPAMLDGYILPDILKTEHNQDNAAAALGALWSVGCKRKDAFLGFRGVEHRQEEVCCINGVLYCNDSKATNLPAAALALKACSTKGPIFWIAGGVEQTDDDLVRLEPWADRIVCGFCIGSSKQKYANWLASHHRPFILCDSLDQAVDHAHNMAQASRAKDGQSYTVLLSPGCASFDQFRDFEHRGEVFKGKVLQLMRAESSGESGC